MKFNEFIQMGISEKELKLVREKELDKLVH